MVFDVGCGSGYFFYFFCECGLDVEYWGIDVVLIFVELGKKYFLFFGLFKEWLCVFRIEDLVGWVDYVVCLNVLLNIDNFY